MLQILPMIAGLLENKQKQNEQKKQNEIGAYMGQAPGAQSQQGGGMLSGLAGMLQGIGGDKKPHTPGDGGPNADGITGPNGGKLLSVDEVYGPTAGTGSYKPEDELL